MELGVSYYPEVVDPSQWQADLENMKSAGLTVIRIMDFAWTTIEPREGEYTFDWLDRFMDLSHEMGIKVILCTPTATPPAWLARQYPQIMVELRGGEKRPWGARRDACVNSPIYRHFSREIAAVMGKRYGQHPAVQGWQLDNELIGPEFYAPECHCPECVWRFRVWLKQRYATIQDLNVAWGTRFWNQEFSDWGEVGTPRHRRSVKGQVIDYSRFFTDSQIEFMREQYDVLRPVIAAEQYITHNSTGIIDRGMDHAKMARAMDVGGWDAYFGAAGRPMPEAYTALAHDWFRAARHEPFLTLETGSGPSIYNAYFAEMRARGSRNVIWWHWRCIPHNAENRSDTFCHYDGTPKQDRLEVVREFGRQIAFDRQMPAKVKPAKAAVLFGIDSIRDELRIRNIKPLPYMEVLIRLYQPLRQMGVLTDVITPDRDLSPYSLVVAPGLALLSEAQAQALTRFVADGGVLAACAPLAERDQYSKYYPQPGGPVREVLGVRLEALSLPEAKSVQWAQKQYAVEMYPSPIAVTTAQALGHFELAGLSKPAVTVNRYGKGSAYYMACVSHALGAALLREAAVAAGLRVVDNPHPELAIVPHLDGAGTWYINHGAQPIAFEGLTVPAKGFVFVDKQGR